MCLVVRTWFILVGSNWNVKLGHVSDIALVLWWKGTFERMISTFWVLCPDFLSHYCSASSCNHCYPWILRVWLRCSVCLLSALLYLYRNESTRSCSIADNELIVDKVVLDNLINKEPYIAPTPTYMYFLLYLLLIINIREDDTPLILTPPSVTLLYLHYWYYCSTLFTPPWHPFLQVSLVVFSNICLFNPVVLARHVHMLGTGNIWTYFDICRESRTYGHILTYVNSSFGLGNTYGMGSPTFFHLTIRPGLTYKKNYFYEKNEDHGQQTLSNKNSQYTHRHIYVFSAPLPLSGQ
jgi:hypothetical protein